MSLSRFSRAHPSPRYRELEGLYKAMHERGDVHNNIPADKTFSGISLFPHVQTIGALIRSTGARTLLDYGAGKGTGYVTAEARAPDGSIIKGLKKIWGLDNVTLYDPGYSAHSTLPQTTFDAVISTDVLEHCPEEDLDWILDEIFAYATRFVYLCIACYPAAKTLPNGENAHITLKLPGWWTDKLIEVGARRPGPRWFATIELSRGSNIKVQGPQ